MPPLGVLPSRPNFPNIYVRGMGSGSRNPKVIMTNLSLLHDLENPGRTLFVRPFLSPVVNRIQTQSCSGIARKLR